MKARFSSSGLRESRCRPTINSYCTLKPSVLRLGANNGGAEVFGKEWGHDTLDDVENAVIIFPFAAFAN